MYFFCWYVILECNGNEIVINLLILIVILVNIFLYMEKIWKNNIIGYKGVVNI